MDARVRELRNAWIASQRPEDEARYLRARVRAGDLSKESLQVAVWLGDEVAREVGQELLGGDVVSLVPPRKGVAKLLEGLPGGPDVQVRALAAALRTTLSLGSYPAPLQTALDAALACAEDPSPTNVERARAARGAMGTMLRGAEAMLGEAVSCFVTLVAEEWEEQWRYTVAQELSVVVDREHHEAVRAAVVDALLPWVLLRDQPGASGLASSRLGEDEEDEVESENERDELAVFAPAAMTDAAARTVLERAPTKRPRVDEARALLEAYLVALGWRRVRAALLHPDRPVRVLLRERVVRLEVGGPGRWRRPDAHTLRQIGLIDVAARLIDTARRRRPT